MAAVDWEAFDLDGLAAAVRSRGGGSEAERTIWAFEEGLRVARLDPELLSDDEWRGRYLPLLARPPGPLLSRA